MVHFQIIINEIILNSVSKVSFFERYQTLCRLQDIHIKFIFKYLDSFSCIIEFWLSKINELVVRYKFNLYLNNK